MSGFRVGVADPIVAARPVAEMITRANYLSAVANRVDSFWVTRSCGDSRSSNQVAAAEIDWLTV
jgi:hypothetical protein